MNAETTKPIVMTEAESKKMLADIKARIMKACRHLTSSRMARNMNWSGVDWRGSTKGAMAEGATERLCGIDRYRGGQSTTIRVPTEAQIEAVCHRFRIVENSDGKFGVIEADRAHLTAQIEKLRASIAADEAKLKIIKAAGKVNYAIENPMAFNKHYLSELERGLATIAGKVA